MLGWEDTRHGRNQNHYSERFNVLKSAYRNEGTGNDWAGHMMANVAPLLIVISSNLECELTFGGTLPTGSTIIALNHTIILLEAMYNQCYMKKNNAQPSRWDWYTQRGRARIFMKTGRTKAETDSLQTNSILIFSSVSNRFMLFHMTLHWCDTAPQFLYSLNMHENEESLPKNWHWKWLCRAHNIHRGMSINQ